MRNLLAVLLLIATAGYPQEQTSAPANPQQQLQSQQLTAPQPKAPQPQIAATNLAQRFNGPTISEVYCAGFISKRGIHASGEVLAGSEAPDQVDYAAGGGNYIYLKGDDIQPGKEYLLLRPTQDPNRYESFPGQLAMLDRLGGLYEDLGRAKVVYIRKNIGIAKIESSCEQTLPGDIAIPYQERARPEFKQTKFEEFPEPDNNTTGRIVMGRDLDTLIGAHRIVYLNIGDAKGVKPGDYFRITRDYSAIANNEAEALPFYATVYDTAQKNPPKFDVKKQIGDLPRRSVGELMVLNTTSDSATALVTYAPEAIHVGDFVEMVEATPFPPPPAPIAVVPQPPTISCSVSRPTIQVGESTNITCNGTAEEGHALTYSYQASAGQITPHDSRATLAASAAGPVTVTATAIDDRSLSAQTTVNVEVQAAPTPVSPEAPATAATPTMMNELTFKPSSPRVDNRAKAMLDDDALRMQRDPTSTIIIEGSVNPSENEALAMQRAENAKAYLTTSKGIDPARIQTRAAGAKTGAKVSVILVPAGSNPQ
jgi:outer membrane protein OmpA-like peptidoglycan-associated protein